jgi:hypothetical protein
LFVTPWFAAATGFVIAASLWIYSPHPQLTFPIAIGGVPCSQTGCVRGIDPQGAPQLAINSGQPQPRGRKPALAGTGVPRNARTAASGLTFGYQVHPALHGNYEVIVSVTGKRAIKNWRLAFVLPGDHIQFVIGAQWRALGNHGLVATPFSSDPRQWRGGPGYSGGGRGDFGNSRGDQGQNQGYQADGHSGGPGQILLGFTVIASGDQAAPTRCRFDGARCTFHQLTSH